MWRTPSKKLTAQPSVALAEETASSATWYEDAKGLEQAQYGSTYEE